MERVGRWVLLAVGVVLIMQTARPHYLYGLWLDDGTATIEIAGVVVAFGMGVVMVALHIGKTTLLAVADGLWRRGHHMYSALALLLFLVLLPVSITSTFGFLDLQRGARAAGENSTHKREADLRSELVGVQAWLKDGGWRRPAALVEAEIAAERRSLFWASTNECRHATTRPEQRFCQALDRSAGELAGAREAEEYRRREKAIYAELRSAKSTTTSAYPDLEFLSRALAISVEKAGFWRTILLAAAIETAEALLLMLGSIAVGSDLQKRPASWQIATRYLLTRWRSCRWVNRKQRLPTGSASASASVAPAILETSMAGATASRSTTARANGRARHPSRRAGGVEQSPCSDVAACTPEHAVAAFVAALPRAPGARVGGSAMFQAYDARRAVEGWPRLSPSQFGRLLKPAVEAAGGRKLKSNGQLYEGFALQSA